jgi:sialate O-acetylesterase
MNSLEPSFGLAAVFGDHMVLQREKPLAFWGRGRPGDTIRLTWQTDDGSIALETRVDGDGHWRLNVAAQPAGGPYQLVFEGSERITLQDVWVGEVWLASGQSNMEWTVAQSAFIDEEMALATEPKLRWLFVERRHEATPSHEAHCDWRLVNADTVPRMTAIGFAFARHLCAKLNVAVGIIDASWGGTPVEAWASADALAEVMDLEQELQSWSREEQDIDAARRAYAASLSTWEKLYLVRDEGNRGEALGWHQSEPLWREDTLNVPTLWQRHGMLFNGAVWFRRDVELPPDWVMPSTLHLGRIDDFDHTYVNGVLVGANPQGTPLSCEVARSYPVPEGVLGPGRNSISVRIFDHVGEGGFLDPARSLFLESATGERVELSGPWQFRVEREVPLVPGSVWQHYPPAPRVLRPQERPTGLFNGMIAPLLRFALRGFIWYQGEANVAEHEVYGERFRALIRDWRRRFSGSTNETDVMPFYFAQLASFKASPAWAYLREAQAQALALPATGMVVTLDIGDPNNIHPGNKREVGRRLALLALNDTYGLTQGAVRGPVPTLVQAAKGEIRVTYGAQAALATSDGGAEIFGFEVEAADGTRHEAPARLMHNQVDVHVPFTGEARALLYAFRDAPVVNLVNSAGLPAEPFRWPLSAES